MSQTRENFLLVSSSISFFSLVFIGGGMGNILGHGNFFVPIGILLGVILGGILRFALFDYLYEEKNSLSN